MPLNYPLTANMRGQNQVFAGRSAKVMDFEIWRRRKLLRGRLRVQVDDKPASGAGETVTHVIRVTDCS